ncbi:hypothetical protein V6N13_149111 [Hibiscus sabdariffa]
MQNKQLVLDNTVLINPGFQLEGMVGRSSNGNDAILSRGGGFNAGGVGCGGSGDGVGDGGDCESCGGGDSGGDGKRFDSATAVDVYSTSWLGGFAFGGGSGGDGGCCDSGGAAAVNNSS